MKIKEIYLVGASGVGKSTLAKVVATELRWKYLKLSAGEAYAKHGVTFESAEADPKLLQKIQEQICVDAADALLAAADIGGKFVAERSVDYGVYSALLTEPTDRTWWHVKKMAFLIRSSSAKVFFIRPVHDILLTARMQDASRRSKFLTDEWVYRVDGAIMLYLKNQGIPFIEIGAGSVEDRVAVVLKTCGF